MTYCLQLSDLAFQRHILVQALIIVEFLLTLTEKSKSKAYYESAQKAMQYDFTLGEEDVSLFLRTIVTSPLGFCRLPRQYDLQCPG
jgi:hypothetical protein